MKLFVDENNNPLGSYLVWLVLLIGAAMTVITFAGSREYFDNTFTEVTTQETHIMLVNDLVPCNYNVKRSGDTLWIVLEPK